MKELLQVLIERLAKKGVRINVIPAFIRDLASVMVANSYSSLQELDRRVKSLGWDDFELDDHTLQLIRAILEPDFVYKPSDWFFWELDPKYLNEHYEKVHMVMLNAKQNRSLQE